jgi:hypothetical protein
VTGIEILTLLFKRAGNANAIRKLLFEPTVAEQAASMIAAVSEKTAEQLLGEAASLPQDEQEATFHQVALLLELASTADENAMNRRRFLRSPSIVDMHRYTERLIWLALIYQILGHHSKAQLRAQSAKGMLPEIKELMDWDVYCMIFFPGSRTEQYAPLSRHSSIPARQAIRRSHYKETLAELASACERVKHLSP